MSEVFPHTKKEKYSFAELKDIIQKLRSDEGCPWDREQTHGSLRNCIIEEAYEVVEGIKEYECTGNYQNLCEELGDVLLQVMLHAEIAGEEGIFTIEDVITGISQKMIRRHPHVFGNMQTDHTNEVLLNWEEIKKQEKKEKVVPDTLRAIPSSFPALIRAQKVIGKAQKEYNETITDGRFSEEEMPKQQTDKNKKIGSMLFQLAAFAKENQVEAEQALTEATENFIAHFE